MKKLFIAGILALSAVSFANQNNVKADAMVNMHAGHTMNGNMEMPMMKGGMMTPEMMKMMEEKGMMKDGKCVMMGQMMKEQPVQKKADKKN